MEFTIGLQESPKDSRNERSRVHKVAMDVLIVPRIAFNAGVEVAIQHDAHLNGTKGFRDACEFHIDLLTAEFGLLGIESGEDVIQQVNDGERDAAADTGSD
jgi:hypothetical protein